MPFKHRLEESMMTGDKQFQKGGNNSQLVQAGTIINFNGIDEKRAREIYAETFEITCKDIINEAYDCANKRIKKFEDSLLPRIMQIENAINVFSDPSFQFLLTSAQKTAAASERDADYDMLSELLVCRIEKGQSRKTRASIGRAVEIVDKIDDDALCALTVIHAVNMARPATGSCKAGIKILADLFEKLMYMELPSGEDWIEHLDILDAIRINSIGHFNKIEEYYPIVLNGYSEAGIKVESDNYEKAIELLSKVNLDSSIFVPNELIDNYVRLPVVNKKAIENLNISHFTCVNGIATEDTRKINEKEIAILESIWDLYTKETDIKSNVVTAFMSEWNSYPSLQKLYTWWNSLPYAFTLTHVGTVLAHTNARRCDKNIPELPLVT